ncbi:hypothetical protein QTP88_007103 [Uroleucon formosanum]
MELLISEVQKHSFLWNKWDKKYRDRYTTEKAWNDIAIKLKLDKEDIKKKWRSLRDTFLKEKRKIVKHRSGDAQDCVEEYNGKWAHYSLMLFLNDTTTPRTTESNISDTFPTENSVHDDNLFERNVDYEIPDTRDTIDADPEYNITLNNNSCVPSSPKSVKSILNSGQDVSDTEIVVDSPAKVANPTKKMKKTYGNSFEDQLLELEREKNNKISALLKNQLDNSENDEDMYFFKSLLPHFKKINSIQKLRMRNQFQAIIINELQSTQTNQRPLLTTASVPYHYDTAGTSYSYPSSSSSAASYYPSHNPEFVEYTNNLQPNIGIQSCQNNSGLLEEEPIFNN